MRLLILSSEFPPGPGGIGTHAWQLARQLNNLGWEIVVLSPQDYALEDEIRTFCDNLPFRVIRFRHLPASPLDGTYRLTTLYNWIKKWQPDIVLASGQRSVWLVAVASLFQKVTTVAIGHGMEFGIVSPWERPLTRWAFNRATAVICVSQYTRRYMLAMGVQPGKETVITNGADAEAFHPLGHEKIAAFRASLGLGHRPLLLTVGNVTDRKGQDIVIRSLPYVLQAGQDAHYVMAGLPTNRKSLTELAQSLGVMNRVHFLGRVDLDTLVAAYNACDVYTMTSRHDQQGDFEGYGIAAVEAAFCGKPAVVSAGSGLEEAVIHGQTGLVVPEQDPESTAHAIIRLLQDEPLRTTLGHQARKRALREQTWSNRALQYDRFLQGLIAS